MPRLRYMFLDNCKVQDSWLAQLIEAMLSQKKLQEFVYKRNMFLGHSLDAITPVITRLPPHNLVELRLVDCWTSSKVMQDLLHTLATSEVFLRSLALV